MFRINWRWGMFGSLIICLCASSGRAEIVAHEPFDYDVGDLDGATGGVGFSGDWLVLSEFTLEVVEPDRPLSYTLPGGATIDGGDRALRFGNDDEDEFVLENEPEAAVRELSEAFEGDELYISFLFRYDEGGFIDNNDFTVWWLESFGDGPQLGLKGNGGDGSVPDDFTGRVNGQFAPPQQAIVEGVDISDEAGTMGVDFFVVGKASREGNTDVEDDYDEFAIWINPAANEAGDPHAVAFGDPIANGEDGRLLTSFIERIGLRLFSQEPGDAIFWDELRLGTTWEDVTSAIGGPGGVPGDFNSDGLVDAADMDALSQAVRDRSTMLEFDLDGNGTVEDADRSVWVASIRGTWFGDANLDGEFNSGDLVAAFTTGQYEDATDGNSGWAQGDWNGDGDFTSSDFVTAFSGGGYEVGPRGAAAAVPEPLGAGIVPLAVLGAAGVRRRSRR